MQSKLKNVRERELEGKLDIYATKLAFKRDQGLKTEACEMTRKIKTDVGIESNLRDGDLETS